MVGVANVASHGQAQQLAAEAIFQAGARSVDAMTLRQDRLAVEAESACGADLPMLLFAINRVAAKAPAEVATNSRLVTPSGCLESILESIKVLLNLMSPSISCAVALES